MWLLIIFALMAYYYVIFLGLMLMKPYISDNVSNSKKDDDDPADFWKRG